MMTRQQAYRLALEKLRSTVMTELNHEEDFRQAMQEYDSTGTVHEQIENYDPANLIINEKATIEGTNCWVLYYNDKRYLEGRDERYALDGNAPVLVTQGGLVYQLHYFEPPDHFIKLHQEGKLESASDVELL